MQGDLFVVRGSSPFIGVVLSRGLLVFVTTRVWTTRASTHKRTRNTHARACAAHAKGVHSMVQRKCPVASHRTRGVHRGELPHLEGEGNCPHTSKFKKIKRYE